MDDDPLQSREAFATLSDDTRLSILVALANRLRESPEQPGMGFSELRRAVGVRDSGNFNYHLDQVSGQFVTETADGYRLSPTGMEVIGSIVSGTYDGDQPDGRLAVDQQCPACGDPMTATYEDGQVRLDCENGHVFRNHLPPGAVEDRSLSAVIRTLTLKTHQDLEMAVAEICPSCYGTLEWSVAPDAESNPREFDTRCERCGSYVEVPASVAVARHPAVTAFYHDHGVDVRETPVWSPAFWAHVDVAVEDDPVRVVVTIEFDGERLVATADDALSVLDVERSPG